MQNRDFWSRISNLYGSPTSPVVLCMQNSVISTRKTSLYGSQPSSVVFACKTDTFGPELHLSICPIPHFSFYASKMAWLVPRITTLYGSQPWSVVFACKIETFGPELQTSIGPRPHLSFCACNTAWIAPESLVCMGPIPHLLSLDGKQWHLEQNNMSEWVPDINCPFVHAIHRD